MATTNNSAPPTSDLSADANLSDPDGWTRMSTIYQSSMGQCTMQAATHIASLATTLHPITPTSHILDNGTGGGSIVRALKTLHPTAHILATDISPGMLAALSTLALPNVATLQADATTLAPLPTDSFSHVLTSAVIQFTADPAACLAAMHRVLQPGGLAVVGIWGPRLDLSIVHDKACRAVMPGYVGRRALAAGSWDTEGEDAVRMREAGFREVRTETVAARFPIQDAEAFVEYWFGSGNPVNETMIAEFVRQGGDVSALKREVGRVVRDEYNDGRGLVMEVVVGSGWK